MNSLLEYWVKQYIELLPYASPALPKNLGDRGTVRRGEANIFLFKQGQEKNQGDCVSHRKYEGY